MSSFFPSQNPLMNTYPLQQPYNPNFYPRPPPLQVPALVRDNADQNTTPLRSQNPIPPSIDVPTNPLVAPRIPVNNFPNLQNDNANNILPFMDETNDEVSVADTQLPFMDETNDDIRLAYTHLPFMDETNDDVRLADFNNNIEIGNIGILKPSTTFKYPDEDDVRIPRALEDDELTEVIKLYDELRGDNTQGRRPTSLEGYNRAIERLRKKNRDDNLTSPLPNRTLTRGSYSTPDQTGRAEDLTPPPVRTPEKMGKVGKKKPGKKKPLPTPE